MLSALLRRLSRPPGPAGTYYALTGFSSFFYVLAFTLSLVYYVESVGLDPLQMVLVGTILEATCFLFEIPTGVVADLYSRRVSVVIGLVLIGGGFVLQAAVPTFAAVLMAQVVWGIGYTFTSGADDAWVTDEVGVERVGRVFLRAQQVHLGATVAGTLVAGALGVLSLRVPMLAAGIGFVVLAVAMLALMREENFAPVPRGDRETFGHMAASLRRGVAVARERPVVRAFLVVSLVVGLSSEAFDRLWTVRILDDFSFPRVLGTSDPALWFAGIALVSTVIALVTSLVVAKVSPDRLDALHPNRLLALLAALQVAGVLGLALWGNLWLALASMWVRNAAFALAQPVQATWLNRHVDSSSRATVLSINAQADAIGQVVGGPPLGVLAGRTSVRTAIVASAALLSPSVFVYLRLRPEREAVEVSRPAVDQPTRVVPPDDKLP